MRTEAMHYRPTFRHDLTPRQKDVLRLVARGRTNFEIATELGISLETVKMHVSEVLSRLEVRSREDAAAWWRDYQRPLARLARAVALFAPGRIAAVAGSAGIVLVSAAVLVAGLYLGARTDDRSAPDASSQPAATVPAPQAAAPGPRVQPFGKRFPVWQSAHWFLAGRYGDLAWAVESNDEWAYWIDLRTGESRPVDMPGLVRFAPPIQGRIFGVTYRGAIFEVDPTSGTEIDRFGVEGINRGDWLHVTSDSFWVSDYGQVKVFRIDRSTRSVVHEFDSVFAYPQFIETDGDLWIDEPPHDSVARIDTATNEMTRFRVWDTPPPRPSINTGCRRCAREMTYHDGTFWFTGYLGIAQWDPKTARLLLDYVFPDAIGGQSKPPVWASDGSMWLVIEADHQPGGSYVARVDTATMAELEQLPLSLVARGHLQLDDDTLLVFGATGEMEKVRLVP